MKAKIVRHKDEGPTEPQPLSNAISLSLMRTCRQIHAECSPILYGENVFRVWFVSQTELAFAYRRLVRHVTFFTTAEHRIYHYNVDLNEASHSWRRRLWPTVVSNSMSLVERFPNLESLTIVLSPPQGQTRRPAFFVVENKTKEQRIALAARWMHSRSPLDDKRLKHCLRMELATSNELAKADFEGSRFALEEDDETIWDHAEFADAFQLMKSLA